MKRYKTLLAGLGRIGWKTHLPAILEHPGFELTAVVDPLEERRAECIQQNPQVRGYAELESALDAERPEITVIASPTCFHAKQTIAALQSGSHVFCDKPAALNEQELSQMVSASRAAGKILTVFQPRRVFPETQFIRSLMESGKLGDIFQLRLNMYRYSPRNDWQALLKNGGGMLLNYGSHLVDQCNALFPQEGKLLACTADRIISCGDAEDVVEILLRYGKTTVDLSINQAAGDTLFDIAVFGSHGSAVLPSNGKKWRVRTLPSTVFSGPAINPELAAPGRSYPAASVLFQNEELEMPETEDATLLYYRNLYDAVTNGTPLLNPIGETEKLVRIIDEARGAAERIEA